MKSPKNLFKVAQKTLLTVLSFCMVLGCLTIPVKAEEEEPESIKESYRFQEQDIEFEIKENREEYVKHFHMSDGKDVAVTYQDAVFSFDGNEYVEIDNQLVKTDKGYENKNNRFWKVTFSDDEKHLNIDDKIRFGFKKVNEVRESELLESEDDKNSLLFNKSVSDVL